MSWTSDNRGYWALTQIMFAKALMRLGEGLGPREGEWNETGRKPVDKRRVDT